MRAVEEEQAWFLKGFLLPQRLFPQDVRWPVRPEKSRCLGAEASQQNLDAQVCKLHLPALCPVPGPEHLCRFSKGQKTLLLPFFFSSSPLLMPTPQVSANVDRGPFIAVNSSVCTQRRCGDRRILGPCALEKPSSFFFHENPSNGYVRFPHSWPALLRSVPVFGFETLATAF